MSEEKVYYDKGNCKITESRAIIDGTTYPMNNISSVSTGVVERNGTNAYIFGGTLILCGFVIMYEGMFGMMSILFILAGGLAIYAGSKLKNDYIVKIGSAGAEKDGLTSQDRQLIDEIVNAINEAIIQSKR